MRRGIAISVALATVLLVAGCTPKFDGEIQGKQKGADAVQVKFKICLRDTEDPSVCSGDAAPRRGADDINHLLGFRVPKGTDVPNGFTAKGAAAGLQYSRSGQYSRELKRLAPTPEGTKWFGFISEAVTGSVSTARYKLLFGLPNDPGKKFKHRPVTGYAGNDPGGTSVDCGDDAFEPSEPSGATAACISDPTTPGAVRKSLKIPLD